MTKYFIKIFENSMKGLLTILASLFCQTILGQFGIVADKDGFLNVRTSPNISNNIIDTLTNGQIVFCLKTEGEWRPIDYHLNGRKFKTGYIHKSRVKLIDNFYKMPYYKRSDSIVAYKHDTIELIVARKKFNPKKNKLQYHEGDASKNEMNWLEKINGKEIWGTDGNVPQNQYRQITLTMGKSKIDLPIDNLFEPNLDYTIVSFDKESKSIYISAMNSDGAGGYAVLWIVANAAFKQRIITMPF